MQLLEFPRLFSVRFHFSVLLSSAARFFSLKFSVDIHMNVAEWADRSCIHIWQILEVAIESWPKWDLHPRPLISVEML